MLVTLPSIPVGKTVHCPDVCLNLVKFSDLCRIAVGTSFVTVLGGVCATLLSKCLPGDLWAEVLHNDPVYITAGDLLWTLGCHPFTGWDRTTSDRVNTGQSMHRSIIHGTAAQKFVIPAQ